MYWADPMDFISEEETLALFKTNINEKKKIIIIKRKIKYIWLKLNLMKNEI